VTYFDGTQTSKYGLDGRAERTVLSVSDPEHTERWGGRTMKNMVCATDQN